MSSNNEGSFRGDACENGCLGNEPLSHRQADDYEVVPFNTNIRLLQSCRGAPWRARIRSDLWNGRGKRRPYGDVLKTLYHNLVTHAFALGHRRKSMDKTGGFMI